MDRYRSTGSSDRRRDTPTPRVRESQHDVRAARARNAKPRRVPLARPVHAYDHAPVCVLGDVPGGRDRAVGSHQGLLLQQRRFGRTGPTRNRPRPTGNSTHGLAPTVLVIVRTPRGRPSVSLLYDFEFQISNFKFQIQIPNSNSNSNFKPMTTVGLRRGLGPNEYRFG